MPASPGDLFERHHLAIYRYVLRTTGRRDVAEDLTQEVFLRVVRSRDRYTAQDRERAWLFRIARNLLADRQRHRMRREAAPPPPGEPARGPHQEEALVIRRALDRLPEADRDAFLLRVVGGLSHEEIATLSCSTEPAVRSRIFRARAALRALLADDEGAGPRARRLKVVP